MSQLSAPTARRLIHTRRVTTRGFLREDDLWDLEGELLDEKTYTYDDRERGPLSAGMPMHHMQVRLTVDIDLTIQAVEGVMPGQPFSQCGGALDPLQALVGASLTSGLRKSVNEAMGGIRGCTHLRELVLSIASTAFQAISAYREQFRPDLGAPKGKDNERPFFMNQCRSWDESGMVVARFMPQFSRRRE